MKAIQTRSPIHLAYEYANLNNVIVSIWVSDSPDIDSTTTPDYQLNSQAINNFATVEISELIRSKNDYIFNPDFYTKRDTAKYVLVEAVLLDDTQTQLEVKYDFLRVRDGYVRRVDGVTEKELPQIYKNIVPTDVRDWDVITSTLITSNYLDVFGGSNAYYLNDTPDSANLIVTKNLSIKDIVTFSVWVKPIKSNKYTIATQPFGNKFVDFHLAFDRVDEVGSDVISYDLFKINDWYRLSMCVFFDSDSNDLGFRFQSKNPSAVNEVLFFNPKITQGNNLNNVARDLLLQDNFRIFNTSNIPTTISFDKKERGVFYIYDDLGIGGKFDNNIELQSVVSAVKPLNYNLFYDQVDGTSTNQKIESITINECKHTPTKVSFINRFGVIQDLVFFKKRTDNIDTDKESYKTNVLQFGDYYPHIGQNQTIRKESKRSVTLNSGFYPEEFNTVFEQLQNSLHHWIDDEPAVLEGSSFNVKTRVNDKLINYTFDFKYSNEEVNTI